MNQKLFLKISSYLTSLIFLFFPAVASAAVLSAVPSVLDTRQPDPYLVSIVLDTQGESINAVEGVITIADGMETPTDILDANSVVNYWVEAPVASRQIKFSGGITGGFEGNKGYLFSLEFPPRDSKNINNALIFSNVRAFRNDGQGTPITVTTRSLSLRSGAVKADLDEDLLAITQAAQNDNIPPEVFNPQVSRNDNAYDGKWFVTFATQDKQSGIDHYEIQESLTGKISPGQWRDAVSPYVLQDQELRSYIFVLARDKQGNERVIKVFPRNPLPWYKRYQTELIILSGLILIGAISYTANYVRRKRK